MFQLSSKSLRNLDAVHPDLGRVARKAIQITTMDFGIYEGVRSYAKQVQYVQEKKSQTLHSLHLIQPDGYAHAIDVFAWLNGKASWNNKHYGPIVQAFITAAISLEVQIEFGHLWPRFQDSVHIQLNQKYYSK